MTCVEPDGQVKPSWGVLGADVADVVASAGAVLILLGGGFYSFCSWWVVFLVGFLLGGVFFLWLFFVVDLILVGLSKSC